MKILYTYLRLALLNAFFISSFALKGQYPPDSLLGYLLDPKYILIVFKTDQREFRKKLNNGKEKRSKGYYVGPYGPFDRGQSTASYPNSPQSFL